MYTSPSAVFLNQTSGYTQISLCRNINYGQLKDTPITRIQTTLAGSCQLTHLDQIMQIHDDNSFYVIQREKMFSIIDLNNKMVTCISELKSFYDSQKFYAKDFAPSMKGIYGEVCSSINEPQLRSKLYCEKVINNNYNYNFIDSVWKESCPTSYKILPISPYDSMVGRFISIYEDSSNEYKVHLGHLYNATTLFTAPALSLRENFQDPSNLPIKDIASLNPLTTTHKLPHIIISAHSYDSCDSGIYILTNIAERHLPLNDNANVTETFFYYTNDTINKRADFLNNLYVEIFNQDAPKNPDGCMFSKSTYQIDKLIENYFDDIISLPRSKRQISPASNDHFDNNYSPYSSDQNLLSTDNSQTDTTTDSYEFETTQSSNYFTNISNSVMNTFNYYFTEIIGVSSTITGVVGGIVGWKIALIQAKKSAAITQIIVAAVGSNALALISDSPSPHQKSRADDSLENIFETKTSSCEVLEKTIDFVGTTNHTADFT